MRLAQPFYRLPIRFDIARLQQEVAGLPAEAWVRHPNGIAGNSALRLITVGGGPNDDVDGVMQATPLLLNSPYLRQVLASLGVVWSRSRLMKLDAHADVPEHADINYHWHYRVRLHIPVFTQPAVEFRCGNEAVHMAAGEAWLFDNWRRHTVLNPTPQPRIHLVADTTGSSSFWNFVGRSALGAPPLQHRYDPQLDQVLPLMEQTKLAPVMHPAEVDLLSADLRSELVSTEQQAGQSAADAAASLARYSGMLDAFGRDWRQLYALFGERADGWEQFASLREQLRAASKVLGEKLMIRTNRIGAHKVLEGKLLRMILPAVTTPEAGEAPPAVTPAVAPATPAVSAVPATAATPPVSEASAGAFPRPRRPVFIIAAPRSGSTLLFETLAASTGLHSLGGEAHWLVEDIAALRPGAPGVDSNRLGREQATDAVARQICSAIAAELRDSTGERVAFNPDYPLLEKTPKNALRIPFFDALFPDAQFIFLWRDPRENLSSIIEAWRSGGWKTYNGLAGFDGPWSLLLPPAWPAMNGRPLEEIAAFQWEAANRIALDDLALLPRERWTSLRYADFIADPSAEVVKLMRFLELDVDPQLAARVSSALPLSRFTQTPPDKDKWRRNETIIERVLPSLTPLWERLKALQAPQSPNR